MRESPDAPFIPLIPGTFVDRPNRFLVRARVKGRLVEAASRDPGRLQEVFRPGCELMLSPAKGERRRTAYDTVLVRAGGTWISVVPILANQILQRALARGGVPGLEGARIVGREVVLGGSRLDFLIRRHGITYLTEVKSATLVEGGRALFPDAPTARGTRHLQELALARRTGRAALVVFIVQRPDARALSPCRDRDPVFAEALAEASALGVKLMAFTCRVDPEGCSLDRRIPVLLAGRSAP